MRNHALFCLPLVLLAVVHCGGDEGAAPSSSTTEDGGSAITPSPTTNPTTSPTDEPTGPDATAPSPSPLSLPKTSAGCGKAANASGAKGERRTVKAQGKDRTFVRFVPAGYSPSRAYPVVAVLHGVGATGAQMAEFVKMQEYAAGKAIVVFPDAASGQWDLNGDSDLLFFDAVREDLEANLCVNRQRVFAVGFSMGGFMTNHLGCKRSATIRAIVPADAGFPGSGAGCGKTAALVYHRTEDDVVTIDKGKAARDRWIGIDGCQKTSKPLDAFGFAGKGCVAYDGCPANTTVSWCEDTARTAYKHDLRDVYRTPIWQWLDSFE